MPAGVYDRSKSAPRGTGKKAMAKKALMKAAKAEKKVAGTAKAAVKAATTIGLPNPAVTTKRSYTKKPGMSAKSKKMLARRNATIEQQAEDAHHRVMEDLNRQASNIVEGFNFSKALIAMQATASVGPHVTVRDIKTQAENTIAAVVEKNMNAGILIEEDQLGFIATNYENESLALIHTNVSVTAANRKMPSSGVWLKPSK